jgi:putative ABC transport system permease protein
MARAFGAAIGNLRRAPAFTGLVVLTLALGIGATTAMFSVVDAVLLRPLPYPGVERFSEIWSRTATNDTFPGVPEAAIVRLSQGLADLAMVEGYQMGSATITGGSEPDLVGAPSISPRLLTLVGATPHLGRLFTDGDVTSTTPVVIISHRLWSTNFGSAPDIIGRRVEIDDRAHTVIGVMSPRVRYPEANAAIWRPLNLAPITPTSRRRVMTVAVRNPDVAADQFAARLTSVAAVLAESKLIPEGSTLYPDVLLQERFGRNSPRAFWLMFGAVMIVLLVACVNVSNLLLARASNQHGEFALRSALGASRSRLIASALGECAWLVMAGGLAGVAVARMLLSVLLQILPPQLTFLSANVSELDWRVLAFAVLVSMLTCVLAGLLPSWRASRIDPLDAIKAQSQTIAGRDHVWQGVLIAGQLSLVVVLLAGAGLLLRSFARLSSVDAGFTADNLNLVTVELPNRRYDQGGAALALLEELERRLEAMGDMQVTISGGTPLTGPIISFNITPEAEGGAEVDFTDQRLPWAEVAPDYFQTLGIPMRSGRTFAADDPDDVVVINDKLAQRYWGEVSPLGKRFRMHRTQPWRTVIGVAGDVRQFTLADPTGHGMELYTPQSRKRLGGYYAIMIRSGRDAGAAIALVKKTLWSMDPKLPLVDARPMAEEIGESLYRERFFLRLTTAFTIIATSLAGVGVYGAFAYWVSRRRREVAIRMAIGASPRSIVTAVIARGLRLAAVGVIVGLAIALAGARAIESMLFEVDPRDPLTFAAVIVLLPLVAIAATTVPAIRASRVDPMTTLRAE